MNCSSIEILNELKFLRGEPIDLIDIDSIPCSESKSDILVETPVVSILVSAYNHEKFIKKALDSILEQETKYKYEIIIGEDCSSDQTRKIIFDYQKKNSHCIRILTSNENVGMTSNFLRMIKFSSGKYVAFCEGDDYWSDPAKLQKQIEVFENNPKVGFLCAYGQILDDLSGDFCENENYKQISGIHSSLEMIELKLDEKKSPFFTPSVMIRSSVLKELMRENLLVSMRLNMVDFLLWMLSLTKCEQMYFIDKPMVVYRRHPGSAISQFGYKVSIDVSLFLYWFQKYQLKERDTDILDRLRYNILRKRFFMLVQFPDAVKMSELMTAAKTLNKYRFSIIEKLIMRFISIRCGSMVKLLLYCRRKCLT